MSFFECRNLKYSYGKKEVLGGVTFSAEAGELVGIIGANGSGKTTLMKSICSLIKGDGRVILCGENLADKSDREIAKVISYIPQRSGIDVSISVLDATLMGFNAEMSLLSRYTDSQRERAKAALAEVGIGHLSSRDYQSLSEGEKQLCIIARSFVSHKKMLLMDEPESSLDFINRNYVIGLIKNKLKENGNVAIVCLHEPSVALRYCDRLVLINKGKCIAQLKPFEDKIEYMEEKLKQIYGNITLAKVNGGVVMLPDD